MKPRRNRRRYFAVRGLALWGMQMDILRRISAKSRQEAIRIANKLAWSRKRQTGAFILQALYEIDDIRIKAIKRYTPRIF